MEPVIACFIVIIFLFMWIGGKFFDSDPWGIVGDWIKKTFGNLK